MSTPLTDARLAEIEARLAAATPGPWGTAKPDATAIWWWTVTCHDRDEYDDRVAETDDSEGGRLNAELIAHSITDLADLVAEVRQLRAAADAVRELLIRADSICSLVGYRYTTGLPADLREALREVSWRAREHYENQAAVVPLGMFEAGT